MDLQKIVIGDWRKGQLCSGDIAGTKVIKSLPCLSVVQAVEGEYSVSLEHGEFYNTGTGGMFIAPAGAVQEIVHCADKSSGIMRARWLFLYMTAGDFYPLEALLRFPVLMPKEYLAQANAYMEEAFAAGSYCEGMLACYKMLILLLKFAEQKQVISNEMARLLDYLHKNYGQAISVKAMAEKMHMSSSALYPLFKKYTGHSPLEYLNDYRLAVASVLLLNSNRPVCEIAQEVGFHDAFYFSRLFSKKYRVSPIRYRKQMRER